MNGVTVRVSATSANIGPGFDSLGIALSLCNTLRFCLTNDDVCHVTGCNAEFCDTDNLALKGFFAAANRLKVNPHGVSLNINADIPVSRGLGSSAALIVGGAVAANALYGGNLSSDELLDICTAIEGHPDNVAPALMGGFTAGMMCGKKPVAVNLFIHDRFRFVALIPPFPTSTHEARMVLPRTIDFADAIHNVSRLPLLVHAFEVGDERLLRIALSDKLHEPYRQKLIRGFDTVKQLAYDCGADAFYISGSGSTCMCISTDDALADKIRSAFAQKNIDWTILPLLPDTNGATITEEI